MLMQAATLAIAVVFVLSACAPAQIPSGRKLASVELSVTQKTAIGKKIWQNECGGTVNGLTTWNVGENFPSLGIGHFIWYPAGVNGPFAESWPKFMAFARSRGAKLPAVAGEAHSPWRSRKEFQNDFNSARMTSLRGWLRSNVGLQTDFIMARSKASLPKILAAAPQNEKSRIEQNFYKVSASPQGTYALIDYVNFKGEGTQTSERYKGQGWGLLQVLGEMKEVESGPAAAKEFSNSAKRVLSRRINNSPSGRGERQWEAGWHNRCATYAKAL